MSKGIKQLGQNMEICMHIHEKIGYQYAKIRKHGYLKAEQQTTCA
jgi:hypothetical protein